MPLLPYLWQNIKQNDQLITIIYITPSTYSRIKPGVFIVHDIPFNNHSLPSRVGGFTLIELLVGVAVLALLITLTGPSFKNMLMNNRVSAEADSFYTALNYARNTALTQNVNVVTCPFAAENSTACGGSWQSGWIVVTQPTSGAPVLLQANNTGNHDATLSSTAANVTFDPRGLATTQAQFTICDSRGGAYAQSIQVLPTGFVQIGSTMGSAVWSGGGIACP